MIVHTLACLAYLCMLNIQVGIGLLNRFYRAQGIVAIQHNINAFPQIDLQSDSVTCRHQSIQSRAYNPDYWESYTNGMRIRMDRVTDVG